MPSGRMVIAQFTEPLPRHEFNGANSFNGANTARVGRCGGGSPWRGFPSREPVLCLTFVPRALEISNLSLRFPFADSAGANEVTNEAARRSRFVVDAGIIPPWWSMERAAQPNE